MILNDPWLTRFRDLAYLTATWSKDPDRQVGAVIVDPDHLVVGLGFNGLPRGADDTLRRDRDHKRAITVHAELNAVMNCQQDTRGCIAVVSRFPCEVCAGVLIQAGIVEVHAPASDCTHPEWGYRWGMAIDLLLECRIAIVQHEKWL